MDRSHLATAPERAAIQFLKRRYASAIGCGDDRTATRLRTDLDRLMNGRAATSAARPTSDPPPAAATGSASPVGAQDVVANLLDAAPSVSRARVGAGARMPQ